MRFDHYHHLSPEIQELIMSAVSDKVAEVTAAANAAVARVQAEVTALQSQVASLQAQITAGTTDTATTADLAGLDAVATTLNALDPTSPVTLPTTGTGTTTGASTTGSTVSSSSSGATTGGASHS